MFGLKINEFDNSDGTIESFNNIFPNTPLEGEGDVEILDIVDLNIYSSTLYLREIEVNGVVTDHDFGYNNFGDESFFDETEPVRFRYFAKDLSGAIIATGFSFRELADKLDVKVGILKRRIKETIDKDSRAKHEFNIIRREL